jgi:PLP dependent protein
MTTIADNLHSVHERIALAAQRAGRSPGEVTLVAVSKTQPVELVLEAVQAGVTHFGENRVQEALAKFAGPGQAGAEGLVPRQAITLHMIGALQRNKAKVAARQFDYVHSVDRVELLPDLDAGARAYRGGEALPVLVEVNLTEESSKAGIPARELPRLVDALGGYDSLRGVGLMTVARMGDGERELRQTFAMLRALLAGLRGQYPGEWTQLSMGMTDDFEYAIEEGATMVRVGRAIFGERVR